MPNREEWVLMVAKQLELDLEIKQDASISDFAGPGWLAIIDVIRQLHMGLIQQLYLYGERDTGKTHLLQAICESFREVNQSVIYLSMRELLETDPMILSALENKDVLAIDDIDAIADYPNWQEAVFHLINLANEFGSILIFASRFPANELEFSFKDLVSRLAKSANFALPSGHDIVDRSALLNAILTRRNWHFDQRIIDYLLAEGPHRIGAMLNVINELQPLFSNLERVNITKAKIQQAVKMIDEQTLIYEVQDLNIVDENDDFLDF